MELENTAKSYGLVILENRNFLSYFKKDNKENNEVLSSLNAVFSKMDNKEQIRNDDEDYNKFCRCVGHTGQQDDFSLVRLHLVPEGEDNVCPLPMYMVSSSNNYGDGAKNTVEAWNGNVEGNHATICIKRDDGTKKCKDSLIIPEFVQNKNRKNLKLMGIVLHHGGEACSGHYTTIKRDKDNKWWHCDDSSVMLQSASSDYLNTAEYAKKNAVLLYYRAEN